MHSVEVLKLLGNMWFSGLPAVTASISAERTLDANSSQRQILTATGSAQNCVLPSCGNEGRGMWFIIANAGATYGIVVKTPAAVTVSTVNPSEMAWYEYDGSSWVEVFRSRASFSDAELLICDPADPTKKTRIDSGSITAATTRVLTMADRDVNLDYAIQRAVVTVSAAEILALRATPKTLVAAPGAGKFLEFVSALLRLNFAVVHSAPSNGGDDLGIRYTDGSGQLVASQEATGFINAAANALRLLKGGAAPVATVTDVVPVDNAALVLHNVGVAEFPGAGTSTLTVEVFYRVRTSAPA